MIPVRRVRGMFSAGITSAMFVWMETPSKFSSCPWCSIDRLRTDRVLIIKCKAGQLPDYTVPPAQHDLQFRLHLASTEPNAGRNFSIHFLTPSLTCTAQVWESEVRELYKNGMSPWEIFSFVDLYTNTLLCCILTTRPALLWSPPRLLPSFGAPWSPVKVRYVCAYHSIWLIML